MAEVKWSKVDVISVALAQLHSRRYRLALDKMCAETLAKEAELKAAQEAIDDVDKRISFFNDKMKAAEAEEKAAETKAAPKEAE